MLPAASAGPIFHVESMSGAFQGTTRAATPAGSWRTRLSATGPRMDASGISRARRGEERDVVRGSIDDALPGCRGGAIRCRPSRPRTGLPCDRGSPARTDRGRSPAAPDRAYATPGTLRVPRRPHGPRPARRRPPSRRACRRRSARTPRTSTLPAAFADPVAGVDLDAGDLDAERSRIPLRGEPHPRRPRATSRSIERWRPAQNGSRSSRLSTLPGPDLGSGSAAGRSAWAPCSRRCPACSAPPARRQRLAVASRPHDDDRVHRLAPLVVGDAEHRGLEHRGWRYSTSSTSVEYTFSPPDTIMSLSRSTTKR